MTVHALVETCRRPVSSEFPLHKGITWTEARRRDLGAGVEVEVIKSHRPHDRIALHKLSRLDDEFGNTLCGFRVFVIASEVPSDIEVSAYLNGDDERTDDQFPVFADQ